jgi:hypothetical protein
MTQSAPANAEGFNDGSGKNSDLRAQKNRPAEL